MAATARTQDISLLPEERHFQQKLDKAEKGIAKKLTFFLRHGETLPIGPDGYIEISQLYRPLGISSRTFNEELCLRIVAQDQKQRFSMIRRRRKVMIRANQGHSISTIRSEKLLTPIVDPDEVPVLIHGTYWKAWPLILECGGLSRMNRTHVHMTTALPDSGEVVSGMRQSSEIAIFVDARRAMEELNIRFFRSSNGVILTTSLIPVSCFAKVIRIEDRSIVEF